LPVLLSSPRTRHLRISVGASESSSSVYGEAFFNSLLGVETGQYLLLLLSDETPRLIQFPGSVRTPTLTLLRALKAEGGDQKAKLFQFLNKIGARALRIQLGRILEMAQSSPDKQTYERKIVDRFGGQKEFEFIVAPQPEMKEAAN
jgi:hypothetical protein